MASGSTISSVCSVPKCRATIRAYPVSSYVGSSAQPMLNVRTGRVLRSAMSPTTMAESSPPEQKAPSGTSATSRRATASPSAVRTRTAASSSVDGRGRKSRSQYRQLRVEPSASTARHVAGGSFWMRRWNVPGVGT